jgi:hypothetical protein
LTAASAEPPGLGITVNSFQVLDAIVDGSPSTAGSPCPTATAANHSAITGSSGHTIVICGKNRMNVAATPSAANSSLAGTFIGSVGGSFTSSSIAANSASSVVLGKWTNVTITSSAGSGKTVIAKIGSTSNQTSPLTTLSGYTALNQPPTAQSTSATTDEDTTSSPITLSATDPDGDATTFSIDTAPAHGTLSAISSPSCLGTIPKTCTATVTYTPSQDYNGSDSFKYKANDGHADSAAATVSITINPVDDPTTVDAHTFSVDENSPQRHGGRYRNLFRSRQRGDTRLLDHGRKHRERLRHQWLERRDHRQQQLGARL